MRPLKAQDQKRFTGSGQSGLQYWRYGESEKEDDDQDPTPMIAWHDGTRTHDTPMSISLQMLVYSTDLNISTIVVTEINWSSAGHQECCLPHAA